MKTLLFLCKGVETIELSAFVDVFGWARDECGIGAQIVTCSFTGQVISAFNIPIATDITFDEVLTDDYGALAIPGGFEEYGFYEDAYDERFLALIRDFDMRGKFIASICVGALPVGRSSVLKGRKATTYHLRDGFRQKQLREYGVDVVNTPITVDGNIITSDGPQTAPGVALKLLEMLTSKEDADKVRFLMGF
jgi:4-methyl-5(b-hydroxyethyl)-thiazole monophosphate biosynthesis